MPPTTRRNGTAPKTRTFATVQFRKDGDGWIATVIVPADMPGLAVTTHAKGNTKAAALTRAGALADSVLQNPLLAAVMPPQAVIAVKLARKLGTLAKLGKGGALKSLWGSVKGAGKQRMATALAKVAS